jgi:hypothetical protein
MFKTQGFGATRKGRRAARRSLSTRPRGPGHAPALCFRHILARLANHLDSLIILADMQYVVVLEMKAFKAFRSCATPVVQRLHLPRTRRRHQLLLPLHLELTDELH